MLVFPMHVGVFPDEEKRLKGTLSLPHARRGVSALGSVSSLANSSSPCTWGCFSRVSGQKKPLLVFPMHVGVFLACFFIVHSGDCLPHARGGVSRWSLRIFVWS